MKAHFATFAAYNAWANRRLYDACAKMSDEERKADAGAFFGSMHGTLDHLLIGDMLWMHRFTGAGALPTSLSEWQFDEFEDLRTARTAMDALIVEYIASLTDRDIKKSFTFKAMTLPEPMTIVRSLGLAHLFNHQTHHRGQCHHMLTAAGYDAPPLDLMYYHWEVQ